jgi:putative FmdB family regulatory protein
MPNYEYRCQTCGNQFTLRLSMSAYAAGVKVECPACASPASRVFGTVNVLGGSRAGGCDSPGCGSGGFT